MKRFVIGLFVLLFGGVLHAADRTFLWNPSLTTEGGAPANVTHYILSWGDVATADSSGIGQGPYATEVVIPVCPDAAACVDPAAPQWTQTNLCGGPLFFAVKARNTAGDSTYSNEVSLSSLPSCDVPVPPTNLQELLDGAISMILEMDQEFEELAAVLGQASCKKPRRR